MTVHAFSALGFDPAPGSPDALASLSGACGRLAVGLGDDAARLRYLARGGVWRGEAAEAFRHRIAALPDDLDRAGDAYQHAYLALSRFAQELRDAQQVGQVLAQRAAQLQDVLDRMGPDDHNRSGTEDLLRGVVQKAQRLRDRVRDDATSCGRTLHAATRHAPKPPSWFSRLVDGGVSLVKDVNDAVGDFVREHAGAIQAFADTMSKLSSVLALVAAVAGPIPVVGQAVATLAATGALWTAGAAMVGHGLLAVYAGGSWKPVLLDLAAVVTGAAPKGVEAVAGRVVAARGGQLGEVAMSNRQALAVLSSPRAAAAVPTTMTFPQLVTRTVSYQFDLAAADIGIVDLSHLPHLPKEVDEARHHAEEMVVRRLVAAGDPRYVEPAPCLP